MSSHVIRRPSVLAYLMAGFVVLVSSCGTGSESSPAGRQRNTAISSGWSTASPTRAVVYEGTTGVDQGILIESDDSVAYDSAGNMYALFGTGGEASVGAGPAATTVGTLSNLTSVVTKTDADGNLVWTRTWQDVAGEMFVASHLLVSGGAVFVGGMEYGSNPVDVDPTAGVDMNTSLDPDARDGIIVELTTDGSYVAHYSFLSAAPAMSASVSDMETASDGALIVAGLVSSKAELPGGQTITASSADSFVARINRTTLSTEWLATLQGSGVDMIKGISTTSTGEVLVIGSTTSRSLPAKGSDGVSTTISNTSGTYAMFHVTLSEDGVVTNTGSVQAPSVSNLVRAVGRGPGDMLMAFLGSSQIVAVSATGSATLVGEFPSMYATDFAGTSDGKLLVAGGFGSTVDFDPGSGTTSRTPDIDGDAFLLTLTSAYEFESVDIVGGSKSQINFSLASAPDGGFALAGYSEATTLNLSNTSSDATFTPSSGRTHMMWVLRYDEAGTTGTTTTTTTLPIGAGEATPTTLAPVGPPDKGSYRTGNKKVTMYWAPVSGAASYEVSDLVGVVKCAGPSASCEVTGLRNGRSYTYSVRSVNGAGVRSPDATSVRVVPGFRLGTLSFKVGKKPLLSSVLGTPSKGVKKWSVTSGKCRISGSRLTLPGRPGSCKLRLSVAKRGSYPSMSTTVTITVTR